MIGWDFRFLLKTHLGSSVCIASVMACGMGRHEEWAVIAHDSLQKGSESDHRAILALEQRFGDGYLGWASAAMRITSALKV